MYKNTKNAFQLGKRQFFYRKKSKNKKIKKKLSFSHPFWQKGWGFFGALAAIKPLVLPGVGKKTLVYVIKTSVL